MYVLSVGAHSHIRGLGLDDALEARAVSNGSFSKKKKKVVAMSSALQGGSPCICIFYW